jgi:hypothetical protein
MAAAGVTTAAYSISFLITIYLYRRVAGLSWRHFIKPPPLPAPTEE